MQTPPSIALGIFDLGVSLSVPANSDVLSDQKGKTPFNQLLAARQLADLDGADTAELTAAVDSEVTDIGSEFVLTATALESSSGNTFVDGGNTLPVDELGDQATGAFNIATNLTLNQAATPALPLNPIAMTHDAASRDGASIAALAFKEGVTVPERVAADQLAKATLLGAAPEKYNFSTVVSRAPGPVETTKSPTTPTDQSLRAQAAINSATASQGELTNLSGNSKPVVLSEQGLPRGDVFSSSGGQRSPGAVGVELASTRINISPRAQLSGELPAAGSDIRRGNHSVSAVASGHKNSLPEQASSNAVIASGKSQMPPPGETLKSILQGSIPPAVASNGVVGDSEFKVASSDKVIKHSNIAVDNLPISNDRAPAGLVKQNMLISSATNVVTNTVNSGENISPVTTPATVTAGAVLSPAVNDVPKKFTTASASIDTNFQVENDGELIGTPRLGDGPRASSPSSMPTINVAENALTDSKWAPAFSARIAWMVSSGAHQANIQLHPAELGAISVQISMQGDNATVQFQTQTAETQDLIEKLMPRLTAGME
ncbi:MAG: flagellar hook-length control protein FliK, partial [Spongiibacteraceae bacterium]